MPNIGIVSRGHSLALVETRTDLISISWNSALSWELNGTNISRVPSRGGELFQYFPEVYKKLESLIPIYSRFGTFLPTLEHSLHLLSLQVISIAENLSVKEIEVLIMCTASSHHLETQMLEIACQLIAIPQVFEVMLPGTSTFIPFVQRNGIGSRTVFPYRFGVSNDQFIVDLINTGWVAPVDTPSPFYDAFWYKYEYSYLKSQLKLSIGSMQRIRKSNRLYENRNVEIYGKYTLKDELFLLQLHKKSLGLLERFEKEDSNEVCDLIKERKSTDLIFCIYAQFQPEATSFPEGGALHNFVDLVVEIRRLGYQGTLLYLEHPATRAFSSGIKSNRVGICRTEDYFLTLREYGCKFVHRNFVGQFGSHVIPITFTGSIGFERSLIGKNTVVTGHPWYHGAPGTHSLATSLTESTKMTTEFPSEISKEFLLDLMRDRTYSALPLMKPSHQFMQMSNWEQTYTNFLDASKLLRW